MSRKRIPLNQNGCTANFRIGVPFEQNLHLWNRYSKKCAEEGKRFYQYRQYCELYNKWCDENYETVHFDVMIAQKMEVDFAGKTFDMTDPLTGEILPIV